MSERVRDRYYGEGMYEAINVIEAWELGFNLGNVIKYICRAGKKTPDKVADLEKAMWYIQREIENERCGNEKRGNN